MTKKKRKYSLKEKIDYYQKRMFDFDLSKRQIAFAKGRLRSLRKKQVRLNKRKGNKR
jgi:hypothetical protein